VIIIPVVALIFLVAYAPKFAKKTHIRIRALYLNMFVILSVFMLTLLNIKLNKNIIYGHDQFSVKYMVQIVPEFLSSIFTLKYYFLVSVLIIPAAILLLFKRRSYVLWAVFGLYFLIYSSFQQNFFFVATGEIPELHTIRYLFQLHPYMAFCRDINKLPIYF